MRRMSMRVVSALSFRKGSDASSGSSGESAIGSGISTSSTGGVAAASPKGLRRMSMRIKAVLVSFLRFLCQQCSGTVREESRLLPVGGVVLSLTCCILLRFDRLAARACRQDRRTMLV